MDDTWSKITVIPPEEMVEVIDNEGVIEKAIPTYYPFEIIGGKVVMNADGISKWDGGWMIECKGIAPRITGKIIGWRKIKNSK